MPRRTTTRDREALLEGFSVEARLAYIAFCAERCSREARRHLTSSAQLDQAPLLTEGVELVWAAAGRQPVEATRVAAVRAHVMAYERPHPGGEAVTYSRDLALVSLARVLLKGMRVLAEPGAATPGYVVGVLDGPAVLTGTIYEDAMASRKLEVAVIDSALERLRAAAPPISRSLFDGIPEWPRGKLTAAGLCRWTAHRLLRRRVMQDCSDDKLESSSAS